MKHLPGPTLAECREIAQTLDSSMKEGREAYVEVAMMVIPKSESTETGGGGGEYSSSSEPAKRRQDLQRATPERWSKS